MNKLLSICMVLLSIGIFSSAFAGDLQPPKYQKDPMQNSAMGTLPKFLSDDIIDITNECKKVQWAIRNYIGVSGKCDQDEECVKAGTVCPFGCNIFVNKKHVNAVNKKMNSYGAICGQCMFLCKDYVGPIVCRNKRCTVAGRDFKIPSTYLR